MATAKIATLAIRTLAKPIATQIKHQAQSHQRFRALCISLAQFMHRTEMILRTNLLANAKQSSSSSDGGGSEKQKIRPLNEAKAVSNGANALAEGFLFALAAALILGESYRGSRSRAKQRDRTEEGLEEMRLIVRAMAERVGVEYEDVLRRAKERQQQEQANVERANPVEGEVKEESTSRIQTLLAQQQAQADEQERKRLQHAVNVLLRLALKSGWIQGPEALKLDRILDGTDEDHHQQEGTESQKGDVTQQQQQQQHSSSDNSSSAQQSSPILSRIAAQLKNQPLSSAAANATQSPIR